MGGGQLALEGGARHLQTLPEVQNFVVLGRCRRSSHALIVYGFHRGAVARATTLDTHTTARIAQRAA